MIRSLTIFFYVIAFLSAATASEVFVSYEDFGAVGDGVHDDLPAIVKAHDHANEMGLPVRSRPDANYHLGRKALTAVIATNTDWNTSRFTIIDRDVEDPRTPLFEVRSLKPQRTLEITSLKRDQKQLDVSLEQDYYVTVRDHSVKRFIRRGQNANAGHSQEDSFILRSDGRIESPIDWDYDSISEVIARPIDQKILTVSGGVFNRKANNSDPNDPRIYWRRNLRVLRSNTIIDGLRHHVFGEEDKGHPYVGFLYASNACNVTFQNCFVDGHKRYDTIKNRRRVAMGTYGYGASGITNFTMRNCDMHNTMDRTRWGVIATNFCKNILVENSTLSRMDSHMGVSGEYIIRGSTLGYMGLKAVGRGRIVIEDSTIKSPAFVDLRSDYGSTWEGTVEIRNSRWEPVSSGRAGLHLINSRNDGTHNFGYPTYLPEEIIVDGLYLDDSFTDLPTHLISDIDSEHVDPAERPFPHQLTRRIVLRDVTTASGKGLKVSPNPWLRESVEVIRK
jgi:hypothetical protein